MILRSRRVVTPSGMRAASIHIRGERIERVGEYDDDVDVDYGNLVIMPGLVDSHVHVNEPGGRTEWEGFASATCAAAAGGVTAIVDMPLNSIPPTTTVAALAKKLAAMEGKCRVDVGLWGGAVPGNAAQLKPMLREGALGFKCFLADSGVAEFGHLDAAGLGEALDALRDTNAPLLVHAELPEHLGTSGRSYQSFLDSRPREAEDAAIDLVSRGVERSGARAHIVHLSSAGGLDRIRRARDRGLPLSAETTPHYLHFEAEKIPEGATEFKCAPPIRDHPNREALWRGIADDLFAAIVSDHSPCAPELKKGDIAHAWGGIASLQFGLPIVWSEGRLGIEQIAKLMCSGPASIAGIDARKGSIAAGFDADLVVWSPEERFLVEPRIIQHRHKITPYAGEELRGVVKATYVRGRKVWEDGETTGKPAGKWIRA